MRRNYGFTLVELLVVISIIGLLISLLLPAVQSARESARLTTCKNQTRQICLALLGYSTANGTLPPGWKAGETDGFETTPGWGWMAFALPYIEQSAIYDKIEFGVGVMEPAHDGLRSLSFSGIACPSSPQHAPTYEYEATWSQGKRYFEVARSHYVGSIGSSVASQEMSNGDS